jgi:hypothetical protein
MASRNNRRDPVAFLLVILVVVMVFMLMGMTLVAGRVLAMPYPFS